MGDMGVLFNAINEKYRSFKRKYGVACPECPKRWPKRVPSILVPGQRCKMDGYVDPRPREGHPLTEGAPNLGSKVL